MLIAYCADLEERLQRARSDPNWARNPPACCSPSAPSTPDDGRPSVSCEADATWHHHVSGVHSDFFSITWSTEARTDISASIRFTRTLSLVTTRTSVGDVTAVRQYLV